MKAQIEMGTVVDALILLRHLRVGAKMWDFATGSPMLPKGFKMIDLDRTLAELEEVKITARDLYPQLRVQSGLG